MLNTAFSFRRVVLLVDDLHTEVHAGPLLAAALLKLQQAGLTVIVGSCAEAIQSSLRGMFTVLAMRQLDKMEQSYIVGQYMRQADKTQTSTQLFFEHVANFTGLRMGHDLLYATLCTTPNEKSLVERARVPDHFKLPTGLWNPQMVLHFGQRVIEPILAEPRSAYLVGIHNSMRKSRLSLTRLDEHWSAAVKDGPEAVTLVATRMLDEDVCGAEELDAKEAKALRTVVVRLANLAVVHNLTAPPASQAVAIHGVAFAGPPSVLWKTICSRTDELYRLNEALHPAATAYLEKLVKDLHADVIARAGSAAAATVSSLASDAHMHTHSRTYVHTHVHTYIRTYIHTPAHTYMHAGRAAAIESSGLRCAHTQKRHARAHMHTCIHIHAYRECFGHRVLWSCSSQGPGA